MKGILPSSLRRRWVGGHVLVAARNEATLQDFTKLVERPTWSGWIGWLGVALVGIGFGSGWMRRLKGAGVATGCQTEIRVDA